MRGGGGRRRTELALPLSPSLFIRLQLSNRDDLDPAVEGAVLRLACHVPYAHGREQGLIDGSTKVVGDHGQDLPIPQPGEVPGRPAAEDDAATEGEEPLILRGGPQSPIIKHHPATDPRIAVGLRSDEPMRFQRVTAAVQFPQQVGIAQHG